MPSRRTRAVAPKAQKRIYPQDTCVGCLTNRAVTEATRTVEELRIEKRRADMSQAEVLSLQEKLHRAEMERDLRQAEVKDLEAKLHVAERDRDQAQQSIQEYQSQRVKHVEKYHQIRKSLDEMCLPYPRVG
ncbi:hypothetical protein LTR06_011193 [Exophiala xenobiotica]|nr:hypothetical protein LTR06_011193 [Exophiala xenobiotica]